MMVIRVRNKHIKQITLDRKDDLKHYTTQPYEYLEQVYGIPKAMSSSWLLPLYRESFSGKVIAKYADLDTIGKNYAYNYVNHLTKQGIIQSNINRAGGVEYDDILTDEQRTSRQGYGVIKDRWGRTKMGTETLGWTARKTKENQGKYAGPDYTDPDWYRKLYPKSAPQPPQKKKRKTTTKRHKE
jgi:hypothetical protein